MAAGTLFPHHNHQSPDPSTPQPYDEAFYIQSRVRALDDEISQLIEERASLLRRWNELKSPARNIPPEVLSTIFRHVCPPINFRASAFQPSGKIPSCRPPPPNDDTWHCDPNDRAFPVVLGKINTYWRQGNTWYCHPYNRTLPLVLGAVCSNWRQVAQSTPELWTTTKLEVEAPTIASRAQLLALHLQSSKSLPLSVELDFRKEERNNRLEQNWRVTSEKALEPIRDVLFSPCGSAKLNTLRLISPPRGWLHLLSIAFPQLEDLSLGWPDTRYDSILSTTKLILTDLAQLRRVTIVNHLEVALPWEQITFLHLTNLSNQYCFEAMFQCKNLKECEIIQPNNSTALGDFTGPPVVLKYLEYFHWSPTRQMLPYHNQIFGRLTLPALQRFHWGGGSDLRRQGPRDVYLNFLTRASMTMTTLELGGLTLSEVGTSGLHKLFRTVSHLVNLTLHERPYGHTILPGFLEVLGSGDPESGTKQLFLPALKVLVLKDRPNPLSTDLPRLLIEMLEVRFRLSQDSVLCIELEKELQWTEECREDFRELVRKGFKLELWENNKRAGWV